LTTSGFHPTPDKTTKAVRLTVSRTVKQPQANPAHIADVCGRAPARHAAPGAVTAEDAVAGRLTGYLASRDLSGFDAKRPPPKTAAWQRMVNMSRATEDAELADALERMGNPDAVTIAGVLSRAEPSLSDYLGEKRNSRNVYKRFEECGYVAVDNPDAKDGLWRIGGKKQVVYANEAKSERDRVAAAKRLAMPAPHVLPPPPY
jgi:hypothetical protein